MPLLSPFLSDFQLTGLQTQSVLGVSGLLEVSISAVALVCSHIGGLACNEFKLGGVLSGVD